MKLFDRPSSSNSILTPGALAAGLMLSGCESNVPPSAKECLVHFQGMIQDVYGPTAQDAPPLQELAYDPSEVYADLGYDEQVNAPQLTEAPEGFGLLGGFEFKSGYPAIENIDSGNLGLVVLDDGICKNLFTCDPGGQGLAPYTYADAYNNPTYDFETVWVNVLPLSLDAVDTGFVTTDGEGSNTDTAADTAEARPVLSDVALTAYWLEGCGKPIPDSAGSIGLHFGVENGAIVVNR